MLYATLGQLYAVLPEVPITAENGHVLGEILSRATAVVDDELIGVDPLLLTPIPPAVEQTTIELARAMWRARAVDGADAQLTDAQRAVLRQLRIRAGAVAF